MIQEKSQFRKLLEKQFHAVVKQKLNDMCEDYTKVRVNGTKEAMLRRIYFQMLEDLQKMKETGKNAEDLYSFFLAFWQRYGLSMTTAKAVILKRVAQQYFVMPDQQSLRPEIRTPLLSVARPTRLTPVEIAPNIWQDSKKCICQQPSKTQNTSSSLEPCYRCGTMCHIQCLWPKQSDQLLECPFCYMRFCNPAKDVQHVFFASYLFKKNRERCQTKLTFNISSEVKKDKNLVFEIRSVRLGCKLSRFETSFPDSCQLSLNGKRIADFRPLPKNTPLKRRADEAAKIEKALVNVGENQIVIDQRATAISNQIEAVKIGKYDHIVMIVGSVTRSCTDIQTKFKQIFSTKTSSSSLKHLIQNNSMFSQDVTVQRIKIPLFCQFYGQRILFPGRSRHCTHTNVFDVRNFIMAMMINTKGSSMRWKCPLCKKRAYDLVIDTDLLNIIQKDHRKKIREVTIRADAIQLEPEIVEEECSELGEDDQIDMQETFKKVDGQIVNDINIEDSYVQQDEMAKQANQNRSQQPQPAVLTCQVDIEESQQSCIMILNEIPQIFINKNQITKDTKYKTQNQTPTNSTSKSASIPIIKPDKIQQNLQQLHKYVKRLPQLASKEIEEQQRHSFTTKKIRPNSSIQMQGGNLIGKMDSYIQSIPQSSMIQGIKNVGSGYGTAVDINTIEIDSDDESFQTQQIRKLQEEKRLLNEMKVQMSKKWNHNHINKTDTDLFQKAIGNFFKVGQTLPPS